MSTRFLRFLSTRFLSGFLLAGKTPNFRNFSPISSAFFVVFDNFALKSFLTLKIWVLSFLSLEKFEYWFLINGFLIKKTVYNSNWNNPRGFSSKIQTSISNQCLWEDIHNSLDELNISLLATYANFNPHGVIWTGIWTPWQRSKKWCDCRSFAQIPHKIHDFLQIVCLLKEWTYSSHAWLYPDRLKAQSPGITKTKFHAEC